MSLSAAARQLGLALAVIIAVPSGVSLAETKEEKERKEQANKQKQAQEKQKQEQEKQRQEQEKQHQDQEKTKLSQEKQHQEQEKQHQDQEKTKLSQEKQHQEQEKQHLDQEKTKLSQEKQHQEHAASIHRTPEQLHHAQEQAKVVAHQRTEALNRPAYKLPEGHTTPRPGAKAEPLKPEASHQVVSQVNTARANMHGVNARPLPHGNVTVHADGALRIEASGGRNYSVRPNGSLSSFRSKTHTATFRPDGRVATLHTTSGITISHSPNGGRYVYHERPDHSVIVSAGPHYGYVQRPIVIHNTTYIQRTYVVNNVTYTRAYVPYSYRGVVVYRYAPPVYYAPAYYHWAYRPWGAPVSYSWSWSAEPWYGYYGSYYRPMPVYSAPRYWLADYLLSEELREAYLARSSEPPAEYAEEDADSEEAGPITDDVREQISLEVQRQLEEERLAAASYQQPVAQPQAVAEVPPAISQPGRVFVVSTPLDVSVDDQACTLSPGDVLRMDAVPQAGEMAASVHVLSSRGQDCTAGSMAMLSVSDLQEMYNNFHEKLDTGMGQMHSNQGGAIPPPPADAMATAQGPGAAAATPAENAAAALAETQQGADQAEADLNREVAQGD